MLHTMVLLQKDLRIILFLCSLCSLSCKRDGSTVSTEEESYMIDYEAPADHWGFINSQGEMVIAAEYDDVGPFSEGLAAANKNGKWGYIDSRGKMVIEPVYKSAWGFHEGMARVKPFDRPEIFIDQSGKELTSDQWSAEDEFSDGLAKVKVGTSFGFIDHAGTMVIQPLYSRAWSFHSDRGVIEYQDKLGVIDKTGKYILPAEFDKIRFDQDHQYILAIKNTDGIVFDRNGKQILHLSGAQVLESDGQTVSVKRDGRMYLMNLSDTSKSIQYDHIIYLEDGMWGAREKGAYKLIHPDGTLVSHQTYNQINKFSDGIAAYSKGEYWGYIDKDGVELTDEIFGLAWDYREGLARAAFKDGIAFIDKNQKLAFYPPPGTLDLRDFSEGLASVLID